MGKQRGMKILRESEENICHGCWLIWLMIEIGETGRRLKGQIEKAQPLCLIARLVERYLSWR